jgi:hypothetical protein
MCVGNSVRVFGNGADGSDSNKERSGRLLEGGDRAVGLGKRGLEMSEDLGGGRPAGRCGRPIGRRTATEQGRADRTLSVLKPAPDPPEGSVAAGTVGRANGGGDAAGDGPFQERPDRTGGQAQPPDFVGEPDADGPAAAAPAMAVAAEDPPGADGSPGTAIIEPGENAVADERADRPAVRARRQLEPLDDRGPLSFAAAEPSFVAHDWTPATERTEGPGRERGGVR